MTYANDLELRTALRKPFNPKLVKKLPRTEKRPALDYVSHGIVTDHLNLVVPGWTYTIDNEFVHGGAYWVRGTMTIGGVNRVEYGDGDDPKDAIGNFIRRGAMRFGVGLDLWIKGEGAASATSSPVARSQALPHRDGGAERGGADDRGEGSTVPPQTTPEGGERTASPEPAATPSGQAEGHHDHHWVPSPTMAGWIWCDVKGCGKAQKAPRVPA